MKNEKHLPIKCLTLCIILGLINNLSFAQNVGIGVADPKNKLEVSGNLVVKSETVAAVNNPTAAQTLVLINGSPSLLPSADSVNRIYDPGGPSGNYVANLDAKVYFNPEISVYGYEINIEEIQLGTGDSLIIKDNNIPLLAVGNNYSSTGIYTFQGQYLTVQFKSNADASLGTGFSLLIKKLYLNPSIGEVSQASLVGNSFAFNSKKGSLRVGSANMGNIANYSMAVGYKNYAEGEYSTAIGYDNKSLGKSSFTAGEGNSVNGNNSIGLGAGNLHDGPFLFSMGLANTGNGNRTSILGNYNVINNASNSFIGGNDNKSENAAGSILIGNKLKGGGSFLTVLGLNNKLPDLFYNPTGWDARDPLLLVGNGSTVGSNALTILKNGNTGIGIDAPAATLHIKNKLIIEQPLATGIAGLEWRSNNSYRGGLGYDATEDRFFFYEGKSNSNIFFLNNGLFGIRREATTNALEVGGNASKSTAGSWLGNSDARLKKNIIPVNNALQKLLQLNGIVYEWNDTQTGYPRPDGIQLGFTAQNVQQIFPENVSTDAQGFLQTAYGTYDALIVEAIRELKNKTDLVEKENDFLKKEIAEIKKMLQKN